jgi:hypothetical protein
MWRGGLDVPSSGQCAMTGSLEFGNDLWSFPEVGKVLSPQLWVRCSSYFQFNLLSPSLIRCYFCSVFWISPAFEVCHSDYGYNVSAKMTNVCYFFHIDIQYDTYIFGSIRSI